MADPGAITYRSQDSAENIDWVRRDPFISSAHEPYASKAAVTSQHYSGSWLRPIRSIGPMYADLQGISEHGPPRTPFAGGLESLPLSGRRSLLSVPERISMREHDTDASMEHSTTSESARYGMGNSNGQEDGLPESGRQDCGCMVCKGLGWCGAASGWSCRFSECHDEEVYHHEMTHIRKDDRYNCNERDCRAGFKRFSDLQRHYTAKHCKKPDRFPCQVFGCKYSGAHGFLRKDKLKGHYQSVHEELGLHHNRSMFPNVRHAKGEGRITKGLRG